MAGDTGAPGTDGEPDVAADAPADGQADGGLRDGEGDGSVSDGAREGGGDGSAADAADGNPGTCDAADTCGGVCVDLQTSAQNCGSCGAVCGGTCVLGRCQVAIASSQAWSYFLAIDGTNVYWTDYGGSGGGSSTNGTVMKAPLAGGAATMLASNQGGPAGITVDPSNVYWVNYTSGTVMSVPINGGGQPTVIATNQIDAWGVAVVGSNVYWTIKNGNDLGAVLTAPITGGAAPQTIATGLNAPVNVALDSANVYWSYVSGATTIFDKAPLTGVPEGGFATTLYTETTGAANLVAAQSILYWTYPGTCTAGEGGSVCSGAVYGAPTAGGATPTVVASGLNAPNGFAVDGTNVYWASGATSGGAGGIMKAPLSGSGPVVLLSNDIAGPTPQSLAVDGTNVYWASSYDGSTGGTGTINKIPKN